MPQKTIFEMAAARGPFIDQSQCLNVHMIDLMDKLTSMHFYAWEIVSITYILYSHVCVLCFDLTICTLFTGLEV